MCTQLETAVCETERTETPRENGGKTTGDPESLEAAWPPNGHCSNGRGGGPASVATRKGVRMVGDRQRGTRRARARTRLRLRPRVRSRLMVGVGVSVSV